MSCYYPNGNPSEGDVPCNDNGDSACCPQDWQCESNGLCYLASQEYYGRYTCTDQSWQSSSCPNICTQDLTAAGDEAILQCSPGNYCCDANRPDASQPGTGCCAKGAQTFTLDQLPIIDSGSLGASGSGVASSSSSSSSSSAAASSSTFSIAAASSSASSSASPTLRLITLDTPTTRPSPSAAASSSSFSIAIFTTVATQQDDSLSNLLTTASSAIAAPTSAPTTSSTPTPPPPSKTHASTIAPAVVVPIAVLALAALAFFLFRRSKRSRKHHPEPRTFQDPGNLQPMYGEKPPPVNTTGLAGGAYHGGKAELDGSPVTDKFAGGLGLSPSTGPPSYRGVSGMSQTPNAMQYGQSPELEGSTPVSAGSPGNRGSRVSELTAGSGAFGGGGARKEPGVGGIPEAGAEGSGLSELPGNGEGEERDGFRPYKPTGLGVVNT